MTLNQIKRRLEQVALSHKQINAFYFTSSFMALTDLLANSDLIYPACITELLPSNISASENQTQINFRFWFVDQVNVSDKSKSNEVEVLSDMTSVAEDYISLISDPVYNDDWTIGDSHSLDFYVEEFADLVGGVSISSSVSVDFLSDRCKVPAYSISEYSGLLTEEGLQILSEEGTLIITE